MHRMLLVGALALALPFATPARAAAQVRDSLAAERDDLREASRRAVAIWNAPATLRVSGSLVVDSSRTITGDVAVYGGTLVVAGHVTGRVAAVNGDVELRAGARVDGEVLVVGGRLTGRDSATIGGGVTVYRQSVDVREEDGGLTLEDEPIVDRWWERWRTRHARNRSSVRLSSGGTYNRIEGLPVHFGPVLRHRTSWGRINAEAEGIYRSARDFRWDSRNIGHDARGEVTVGDDARGIGVGGRLYDVVAPVEDWHVGDAENGFASFFLHRDFRDHFDRHGGAGWIRAYAGEELELRLSLADERWGNRADLDPWTLFRDDARWRPNPTLDEGRFHLATAMLHFDSRNDVDRPWSGWYAHTEVERGTGVITSAGSGVDLGDRISSGRTDWVRAFIDVRKYSRLAPNTLLNLRLVTGGWLGGDALPLNRRLSLGGAGSLPGYDFRGDALPTTVCSGFVDFDDEQGQIVNGTARGVPANCERIALAQVEYRTDLNLNVDLFSRPSRFLRIRRVGQWVLFANSGRGWLVGPRVGELQYRAGQFPTLSTFRTDIGGGLDFGRLGFYIAKSVSDGDEPPNFFVRLRRRF